MMNEQIIKVLYNSLGVLIFLLAMTAFLKQETSLFEMEKTYRGMIDDQGIIHLQKAASKDDMEVSKLSDAYLGVRKGYVLDGELIKGMSLAWKQDEEVVDLYYNKGQSDELYLSKVDYEALDQQMGLLLTRLVDSDDYIYYCEGTCAYIDHK